MSDVNKDDNKFDNQVKNLDEVQKEAVNPAHYIGSRKVPPNIKMLKKNPVLALVLGLIGAALTAISIFITYSSSSNVSELMIPLLYNFIPFIISFVLIKIGIAGLIERKK
jgi:high-affinity K+ transport system ATPase subunit B